MDENENFEALRKLLELKRHEIPPPGYFHNFSGQVISRIRSGEHNKSSETAGEMPWFLSFIQIFDAKPAFAGLFASALCLLLVFGIVNAERPDMAASQPTLLMQTADNTPAVAPASTPVASQEASPAAQPTLALNSTNPLMNFQATAQQAVPVNELFGQPGTPSVQDVSFTPPGQQ